MMGRIGVVKERPNFGNQQVKKVSEIEMGKRYIEHYWDGSGIIIPIRVMNLDNDWIFEDDVLAKGKYIKIKKKGHDDIEFETDYALSDLGVIPYENGMWNATNWLEKL